MLDIHVASTQKLARMVEILWVYLESISLQRLNSFALQAPLAINDSWEMHEEMIRNLEFYKLVSYFSAQQCLNLFHIFESFIDSGN